jgi:hypothetical protein
MMRALLPALRQQDACACGGGGGGGGGVNAPPLLRRAAVPHRARAPYAAASATSVGAAPAPGARRAWRAAPAPTPTPPSLFSASAFPPRCALATFAKKGASDAAAAATSASSDAPLGKGSLVTFDKGDGRELLVLITRPDGKTRWFGTDAVRC